MTAARSARRQAVLAARADVTVRGPILTPLACGCICDDTGAVWSPCPAIAGAHRVAVGLARQGIQPLRTERRPYVGEVRAADPLTDALAVIAAHVAEQERAAHSAAEQGSLL